MPTRLCDWADRLENRPLPAMTLTVRRISQLINRPSTTHADYQRVIGRDPGFALAVFRGLEQAPHRPREPTGNLAHAIALLGITPLIAGTKGLPVLKEPAGSAGQGLYASYSRAGHAAWYAYHWGLARKDAHPEEMALAALFHDCGEMSLWTHAPTEMEQIERCSSQGVEREAASTAVLGFSLDQLSLTLAKRWRLPPLVAEALTHSGAFESRSLTVMLASAVARASAADWQSEETRDLIELVAEQQRLTVDRATAEVHSLTAGAARALAGLPLPPAAIALVQRSPNEQRPRAPEKVTTSAQAMATPGEREKRVDKSTPPTPPAGDPPRRRSGAETDRLQQRLGRLMRELRETLGMDRAMFAMLTPDRKALRSRLVLGGEQPSRLRDFELRMDEPHLFSLLMAKPQGLWLHPGNREKYLPMIPLPQRNSLNTAGFFVSSLFLGKQPLGLLYGDCSDVSLLNSERFGRFKKLSQQLHQVLDQGR